MHHVFASLVKGKPELEPWFNIVHCDTCHKFTPRPFYLGCTNNHTFCGQCLLAHIKLVGKMCPICDHAFGMPDPLTFDPHVHALLGLVDVRMASRGKIMRAKVKEREPAEEFVWQLLQELCKESK